MKQFIIESLKNFGTGLMVGVVFSFFKLNIPSPPVLSATFGIMGITAGYILFQKIFG